MDPMGTEDIPLSDWSGFTNFGGRKQVYAPANDEEVVRLVRLCLDHDYKLRVVGLQTAWNTLWYCEDVMMTTRRLNVIKEIDVQGKTITCGTGVTLGEVHKALWEKGLTLDTGPGVDWVTVGGAISTGSHGSGRTSISSSMTQCRVITGGGDIVDIGKEDHRLDAVRISLGLLGILTTVTLQAVDAFHVTVKGTRIRTADWGRFLNEGEMSYLLCFPHTGYSVLIKVDIVDPPSSGRAAKTPGGTQDSGSQQIQADMREAKLGISKLANRMPATFPARNRYLLDVFFPDFEKTGPAHEMLMSYTSDPIAGAEWAIPVDRFENAFAQLQRESEQGDYYLPPIWLKKVAGETPWLSAADRPSIQCGIYHDVIPATPSRVQEMVTRVEEVMLRHGGRPHLAKLIYMKSSELKQAYPGWAKFDALRRRMDPKGLFWSKAIEARFGIPTN